MKDKIEAKIKNLLDFECLGSIYSESFKRAVDHWLSVEEAHEHGESPFTGENLPISRKYVYKIKNNTSIINQSLRCLVTKL
jgi:hypothetical protein